MSIEIDERRGPRVHSTTSSATPGNSRTDGYVARGRVVVKCDPAGIFAPGARLNAFDIVTMVNFMPLGFTVAWPGHGLCVKFPRGLIDQHGRVLVTNARSWYKWTNID